MSAATTEEAAEEAAEETSEETSEEAAEERGRDPLAGAVPQPPPRFSFGKALLGAVALLLLLWLLWSDIPICLTQNFFGVPCPGCGLTRATFAMVQGDFASMLHFHPLAPIFTPLVAFLGIRAAAVYAGLIPRDAYNWVNTMPSRYARVLVGLLLGLWVARLFGLFGGLPDEIDLSEGWIAQAGAWLWHLAAR